MSARSTISVFACGMSIPDSMIVVETRTSASPARKACIRSSSTRSTLCPCARRNGQPRVAWEEGVHPLLEHALAHLPVRDEKPKVGTELLELLGRDVDRLD